MRFADELKRWRDRHSLTQIEASNVLYVSVRTLQEWEQGRMRPFQQDMIRRIMYAYIGDKN